MHNSSCYVCSHGTAARGFDEATFVTVFKQLEKVEAASAAELQVLRACLVLCYKDAKKHDFTLQLKGGPKLRSIRKLIVDWQQRKKVVFHLMLVTHLAPI